VKVKRGKSLRSLSTTYAPGPPHTTLIPSVALGTYLRRR